MRHLSKPAQYLSGFLAGSAGCRCCPCLSLMTASTRYATTGVEHGFNDDTPNPRDPQQIAMA